MALGAITLPDDLKKYLVRATRGEMEVRVRGVQEGARTVYTIGRQIIYTAIGLATGYGAFSLHTRADEGPRVRRRLLWSDAPLLVDLLAAPPHSLTETNHGIDTRPTRRA